MIAAIVGAIIFIVLLLGIVWFVSPVFRAWTEKPNTRCWNAMKCSSAPPGTHSMTPPTIIVKELTAS